MTKKSYARRERDRKIAEEADRTLAYIMKRQEEERVSEEIDAQIRYQKQSEVS